MATTKMMINKHQYRAMRNIRLRRSRRTTKAGLVQQWRIFSQILNDGLLNNRRQPKILVVYCRWSRKYETVVLTVVQQRCLESEFGDLVKHEDTAFASNWTTCSWNTGSFDTREVALLSWPKPNTWGEWRALARNKNLWTHWSIGST